jgi:DUF1680 family protein
MKFYLIQTVLVIFCLTLTGFDAQAITITYSATQPTIENSYVYHLGESTTDSGNVAAGNDAATYIAHDRQGMGQTFTTGPGAYRMSGFWLKHVMYTSGTSWWNTDTAGAQLEIRVTEPSAAGTPAFEISAESYTVTGTEPVDSLMEGATGTGTGTGTWVYFELDTPVLLQGEKEYGFDVTVFSTGNNYFFETAGKNGAGSYMGGTAYSSGSGVGTNSLNMDNIRDGDHVFIVQLVPTMPDNGDLTGNGKVDMLDLAVLANGWQSIYDIVDLQKLAANWLLIVPAVFKADPIIEAEATSEILFSGTLIDNVKFYDVSQLTFSKAGGPQWLNVDANGALWGTPSRSDEGANNWTVQVSDGVNAPDQATLQITVHNLPLYSQAMKPVYLNDFVVEGFWKTQYKRQITKWIIHCIDTLNTVQPYGIAQFIEAKKALDGLPHASKTGDYWSDAYVHNTVESMCLALSIDPNGDPNIIEAQNYIQTKLNEWIPIILNVQQSDGYIDTLVLQTIDSGYVRYSNRSYHESYVQAYFIESGIAHYQMTKGQDFRLYNAAKKCGDHFYNTFLVPQRVHSPGHEVIEMALCRLGRLVNEVEGQGLGNKYIDTAKWLMDCRGGGGDYDQNHLPVIQQTDAVGHAVRASYLYTGMTDIVLLQQDDDYLNAVNHIWDSAVNRKMYLTGGIGATSTGEAFAGDYVLPNNSGYCETCASCGFVFWNNRMNWLYQDAKYADVVERTIYNNILSAVELAGQKFYYQQPLDQSNARYPWHSCPCCVGNIPRTILALKDNTYLLNEDANSLYINYFIAGRGTIDNFAGTQIEMEQQTDYPYGGIVNIIIRPQVSRNFSIKIRIPDRTESALYTATPEIAGYNSIEVNGSPITPEIVDGYITITRTWNSGDTITLDLPMEIQMIKSVPQVSANLGKVALRYGPLVYNLERVDHNVSTLDSIYIEPKAVFTTAWNTSLFGEDILTIGGTAKLKTSDSNENIEVLSIPHYTRLNRGGRTIVWIADNEDTAYAPPPPVYEMYGWWKLDETNGTTAADSSGKGRNGTLVNGPVWIGGKVNNGLQFDGIDDYVDLPDDFNNFQAGLTINVWAYPTVAKNYSRFVDLGNGSSNENIILARDGTTSNLFGEVWIGNTRAGTRITATGAISLNAWQMFTMTVDSAGNTKLYKNGVVVGSGTTGVPNNVTRTSNFIGRSNWSGDAYYQGIMDEVRIYSYPLTQTQIQAIYSGG